MNQVRYTLLLNQCLKRHILGLRRKERERLREKFEFLEAGIWDSGVRVKKLKGVSGKVVFEARRSKGDRIVFTLGRHGQQAAIYVWGLLQHDDVGRSVRRLLPENAPFLDFEPDTLEEYPDVLMDDLAPDYFSQEAIEEVSPEDHGPQKWLVLNDEEWKRLLLAQDPENFEMYLFLTPEQRRMLESEPPLLLSGTAGSGKTTLSVYYLLNGAFLNRKRLFLTYNPFLSRFSHKIYTGLVTKTSLENAADPPDFYVFRDLLQALAETSGMTYDRAREVRFKEFEHIFRNHRFHKKYDAELVWEEIRSIIKGAKSQIDPERLKKLSQAYLRGDMAQDNLKELKECLFGLRNLEFIEKVDRTIAKKTRYSELLEFIRSLGGGDGSPGEEDRLVLGEILKAAEKRVKGLSAPLLTYREYLNLGRKRAPNFLYERKEIYEIAEFYQGKLEERGCWDEIDLCRQALQRVGKKQGTGFRYDLVVCDEVQDFADIQLSLIFSLTKSHKGIVLTGDPKQIINPSGFRWEEVKNKFYERGVEIPDVHHLHLNFRCVGNIVRLSNALLDLKQQLIGLSGSELREEWKFNGRPPVLLTGMGEGAVLDRLHLKGAGRIILVRDDDEKQRLRRRLGTGLIFTISEAKGLEFDTVFLWNFTSDRRSGDTWRRIKNGTFLDRSHTPHIRHEINLLYVAVTRARNTLIIFDSRNDIWELPGLRDLVYRTGEEESLTELWQTVSTPEAWRKQGDYFFEREYYSAAAECYKNGADLSRAEIATAFDLEDKKRFRSAARLFDRHGYARKAAECYENSGLYSEALPLWRRVKDKGRARICRIRAFEQSGDYDRAAEGWRRAGEQDKALECWRKGENHRAIAEYHRSRKKYGEAAEAFERARDYGKAAACYKKHRQLDRAADLYYRAGEFDRAIPLYKKLKRPERLLACYEGRQDHYNAALLHEKAKETDKAIKAFAAFAQESEKNERILLEEAKRFSTKSSKLKSAIRLSALGRHEQSAPVFLEKRLYGPALAGFKASGNHEGAARCLAMQKDYYEAAQEWEKSDAPEKWARMTEVLSLYVDFSSGDYQRREARVTREAGARLEEGCPEAALARYRAVEHSEAILKIYLKLERDEEALGYFLARDLPEHAGRYLEGRKDLALSPGFVDALVSDFGGTTGWYQDDFRRMDMIARILGGLLKSQADDRIIDQTDRFLEALYPAFFYDERPPKAVLDLMLEAGACNAIIDLFSIRSYKVARLKRLKPFLADLKRKSEEKGDRCLFACYCFLHNKARFEDALGELPISKRNHHLFAESRRHYREAVRFLAQRGETEGAVNVCLRHRDHGLAARLYEDAEDDLRAAREYRDGKLFEDAMRCYRKLGDEQGIARVYERMGKLDQALTLWRKLGRAKEVSRVLKKSHKSQAKDAQQSLF